MRNYDTFSNKISLATDAIDNILCVNITTFILKRSKNHFLLVTYQESTKNGYHSKFDSSIEKVFLEFNVFFSNLFDIGS